MFFFSLLLWASDKREREGGRERERGGGRERERGAENAHSTATTPKKLPRNFQTRRHRQYDWLVREKVADGALIAKWRKPGYEFLCSLLAIQRAGTNFGTTALCRVPLKQRTEQQKVSPSVQTGCVSCASCDAGKHDGPIWWDQLDDDSDEEQEDGEEAARRRGEEQPAAAAAAAARRPPAEGNEEEEEEPAAKRAKPSDAAAEDDEEGEEDEEELDEEVQKRLQALKEGGGG